MALLGASCGLRSDTEVGSRASASASAPDEGAQVAAVKRAHVQLGTEFDRVVAVSHAILVGRIEGASMRRLGAPYTATSVRVERGIVPGVLGDATSVQVLTARIGKGEPYVREDGQIIPPMEGQRAVFFLNRAGNTPDAEPGFFMSSWLVLDSDDCVTAKSQWPAAGVVSGPQQELLGVCGEEVDARIKGALGRAYADGDVLGLRASGFTFLGSVNSVAGPDVTVRLDELLWPGTLAVGLEVGAELTLPVTERNWWELTGAPPMTNVESIDLGPRALGIESGSRVLVFARRTGNSTTEVVPILAGLGVIPIDGKGELAIAPAAVRRWPVLAAALVAAGSRLEAALPQESNTGLPAS